MRGSVLEGLEFTFVTPGDGDLSAVVEKGEADRAAKAAGAAGNENNFCGEVRTHWRFPLESISVRSCPISIP